MEFPIEAFREAIDELCLARKWGSLPEFVWGKNKHICSWENEVEDETNHRISCANGVSKLVFLSDSFGKWVLKIPRDLDTLDNYCEKEADNYADALEEGLDEFFAPTFFVEEYLGIPFYAQLRLDCNKANIQESFYSYAKMLCDSDNYEDLDSYDDVVYSTADNLDTDQQIIAVFGDSDTTLRLCDFCEEREINDLHEANFGELDGVLLICDFSGF